MLFINGFSGEEDQDLLPIMDLFPHNTKIIPWNFPLAEDQRENMLTAFVFGSAEYVETPYWFKLDADAYAEDFNTLITDDMKNYVICGHKWGYSWARHIKTLVDWSNKHEAFSALPNDVYDMSRVNGRRYSHARTASYAQFHNSAFVRYAAQLAGDRLPVPSHDTYLWYVANRLDLPIKRHNFKRYRGMNNKTQLDSLKEKIIGVDKRWKLEQV